MNPKRNLLLATAESVLFPIAVAAQKPAPSEKAKPGAMMQDCRQMMEMHQKVQSEMKAMDDELDTMVAEMNAAEGGRKIDVMAKLLTRMVEQRKTMRTTMEEMQTRMMAHMSGHMQSGGSMASCPMMSGSAGAQHQHSQAPKRQ